MLVAWLVVAFLYGRSRSSRPGRRPIARPRPISDAAAAPLVFRPPSTAPPAAAAPPARNASVRRYRRHFVATAVVSVLAASAALPTLASPSAATRPKSQLRLVDAHVLDEDPSRFSVAATIVNDGDARRRARVWWVLSPPGDGPEWERRAYRSPARVVVLEPGATTRLDWAETVLVPNGRYVFSAWVHAEGPRGFVHADGLVGRDLRVASRQAHILRHAPPRVGLEIGNVDVRALRALPGGPVEIGAEVTLHNHGPQLRRAYLRWRMAPVPVAGEAPTDWWRRPPTFTSPPRPVELTAGSSSSLSIGESALLRPGVYSVEVLLESVAHDIDGPLDQVVLATPVVVPGDGSTAAAR